MGLTIRWNPPRTQLFGLSKERVRREYANIQEELHWWRLLPQHTGVDFSGSAIDVFWSQKDFGRGGLIPHIPYKLLKESITKVMEETRGTCKDNNLDPDAYIEEVVFLLEGLIDSVYQEMVRLEQNMRKVPRENTAFRAWEVESSSDKLKEYLRERAAAAKLLGKGLEGKAEPEQKAKGSKIMITARTSKENWQAIRSEYDISKIDFARKIKFVKDKFKKNVIFRDVEQAFVLSLQGFSKPALILAGGVIEELLRLYLEHKNIKPEGKRFVDYIKACEDNGLLKRGVSRLSDSIRDFRNLVHLGKEETKRHTISKATAKGAVSSIFTIANDFQ